MTAMATVTVVWMWVPIHPPPWLFWTGCIVLFLCLAYLFVLLIEKMRG